MVLDINFLLLLEVPFNSAFTLVSSLWSQTLWNCSSLCAYVFWYVFTNCEVRKDGEVGAEGSKWKMLKAYILK